MNHGIIAHGPIVKAGGGFLARRTVLRDLGTEYVVHTQVFHEDGKTSFCHGHYFPLSCFGTLSECRSAAVNRFREKMIS